MQIYYSNQKNSLISQFTEKMRYIYPLPDNIIMAKNPKKSKN